MRFDDGADWFDIHQQEEDLYHIQLIKEDRKRRVKNLSGKYVIVCDGKKSGKRVFLQDQKVSGGGYWTQYLSNAIGFSSSKQAEVNRNVFKYGNPKIYMVDSNGNLRGL